MSHNPTTTAKVNGIVYDIRHWKLTLAVLVFVTLPLLVFRILLGRDLRGGRTTDATFFRSARQVRGHWWASVAGWKRAAVRIAALTAAWLWFAARGAFIAVVVVGLLLLAWFGWRRWKAYRYEKNVLRPVWPAVAGIIGIPEIEPPAAWLDVQPDKAPTGSPYIVVGLREADADDHRRIDDLIRLFNQRYGVPHTGHVDYANRLAKLVLRPAEPDVWPAVARILGVGHAELACDWLELPDDLEADGAQIAVRLPADTMDDAIRAGELQKLFGQRSSAKWRPTIDHITRTVTFRHIPKPPGHVAFADYSDLDKLSDLQFYVGKDWERRPLISDLGEMESPHVAVAGGSRSGKTTFLAKQIAQAASKGAVCLVLDPKYRFRKIFGNDIPNILIYDDVDQLKTDEVSEWELVMCLAERIMEQRLAEDNIPAEELEKMDTADVPDLNDRARYPTIYVYIDEGGPFRIMVNQNWENREGKGSALIFRMELTLLMRGREARVFLMKAMHQANAGNFPGSTEGRQLYGNRFVLGVDVEDESWRMLAGSGRPKPPVPATMGAGVWLQGPSVRQLQVAEIKHRRDPKTGTNEARELAKKGIPILRERGLLDDRGRLVLPGVGVLLPGGTGRVVADTGTPTVRAVPALPPATESTESPVVVIPQPDQPEPSPLAEFDVIGYGNAAILLGYDGDDPAGSFKKARERAIVAGTWIEEVKIGRQWVWRSDDLKLWQRARPIAGRKTTKPTKEA
jgi:DNA translocase FtsK/SpoIIIE-like protein